MGEPYPIPPKEPETRASDVTFKVLVGVGVVLMVVSLVLIHTMLERCSGTVDKVLDEMGKLRTDAKWLDPYRKLTPVEAESLFLRPGAVDRAVVVRGVVLRTHTKPEGGASLDLEAGDGARVHCVFGTHIGGMVKEHAPGEIAVVGGRVGEKAGGVLQLTSCYLQEQWKRY
ncbi:MAG: hypothetical protein QNJ90_05185 [Planctomycetota bacterium]|nr:hypothetical protein [Planctomycetota bacterium]